MRYTKGNLKQDLENIGLKREDAVLIQSSYKSIGDMKGRADMVADALMGVFYVSIL